MLAIIIILIVFLGISIGLNIFQIINKPKVISLRDKEIRTALNTIEIEIKRVKNKYRIS